MSVKLIAHQDIKSHYKNANLNTFFMKIESKWDEIWKKIYFHDKNMGVLSQFHFHFQLST